MKLSAGANPQACAQHPHGRAFELDCDSGPIVSSVRSHAHLKILTSSVQG
jgi:hypothetical protein